MASKVYEVAFKINGELSGRFASAMKAATAQMDALKKSAEKTNVSISKDAQNLMTSLAGLEKVAKKMTEYGAMKQKLPEVQSALNQEQAKLEATARAAQIAASKVNELKSALDNLKASRQQQKDIIAFERGNQKTLKDANAKILTSTGYKNLNYLEKALKTAQDKNETAAIEKLSAALNQIKANVAEIEKSKATIKQAQTDLAAVPKNTALNEELKKVLQVSKQADQAFQSQKKITEGLQGEVTKFASQMQQLKSSLASSGVDVEKMASAESRLKTEIDSVTAALQRQAQAANLLSQYQALKPQIDALKRQKLFEQKQAAATDLKVRKSQARENVLAIASQVKDYEQRQAQANALGLLNSNLAAMQGAWYNLANLNKLNAKAEPFKTVTPTSDSLADVKTINKALAKGKGFGEGLTGTKNILAAINAYKNLNSEISANQKTFKNLNRQTAIAARNYQTQAKAVQNLKSELEKYTENFKKVEKSLDSATAQKAVANIKAMKNELAQAEQVLKQLGKVFDSSKNNGQIFKTGLREQSAQLQSLRSSLSSAGVSVNNLSSAESQLQSIVNATTQSLQRQAQISQQLAAAQNQHSVAQSNLNDAQSNFQTAQNLAGSIMSPFTNSIETAKDFEHQMSKVKALTQMDNIRNKNFSLVDEEMAELTAAAKREGLRTRYSALEAAKGETYLAYAGWNTKQITAALPSMLDLAASADMSDLGRVSDITSDIMMAFKMPAEQAQRMADVLAYTVTHSNQNLEQLYESMKYAAPIARAFGSSIEETASMTKFMADAGIKSSMAGTSMRAIMTRLVAPPKTITKTMQENGITLDDANKEWANAHQIAAEYGVELKENLTAGQQMASVIRQINKTMSGKTSQEKMAVFKAISGLYAVSGALNLFETGGEMVDDPDKPGEKITRIELFTKQLEKSQGSARQTADVMMDDYAGQMLILNSAFENLRIELGHALTPVLRAVSKFATGFVQAFAEFNQQHPHIVQGLAAIAAGISALIVTTAGVALTFAAFEFGAAQLALFRAGLMGAEIASAGLAVRLGAVAASIRGLGIFAAIAPLLKISGWGMIGTGIAGAFAGLRSLGFVGILTAIFTKLKGAIMAVFGALKTLGGGFLSVLRAAMVFALSPVGAALMVLGAVAFAVYKNWDSVKAVFESLANTMSARLSPALENVQTALSDAGAAFGRMFDSLGQSGAADLLAKSFIVAVKVISQVLIALVQFASNIVATLATMFGGLADIFANMFNRNWEGVKAAVTKMNDDIIKYGGAAITEPLKTIAQTPSDMYKAAEYYDKQTQKNRGLISPSEAAARRHAVTFDENGVAHSKDNVSSERIAEQVEAIKAAQKFYLPSKEAVIRHRQDATPAQVKAQLDNVHISEMIKTSQEIQRRQPVQSYTYKPVQNEAISQKLTNQMYSGNYNKSNYGIDFWGGLANLFTSKASAATPEAVQNLNTVEVQSQLNNLGNSATQNAVAINNSAVSATQNTAALTENSAAISNASAAAVQNATSVQNMATTADNSTSSISNMASASSSASSSILGLGDAALSAISGLLSAAATAGSDLIASAKSYIFGDGVAKNASGGIYNHGAFLTWFAEKSPEAAIPLDGSSRAIELWKRAGEFLGVYPAENYNGGIYDQGGGDLKPARKVGGGVSSFIIEGLAEFVKAIKFFTNRSVNLPNKIESSILKSQTQNKTADAPKLNKVQKNTSIFQKSLPNLNKANKSTSIFKSSKKNSDWIFSTMERGERWGQNTAPKFNWLDIFNGKAYKKAQRNKRNAKWIGKNFNSKNVFNGKIFKRVGSIFKNGGGLFGGFDIFNGEGKNKNGGILTTPPTFPTPQKGGGFNIADIFNGKIFKQTRKIGRNTRSIGKNAKWIGKNFNSKNIFNGKIFKRVGGIFKKGGGLFGGFDIFHGKGGILNPTPTFPENGRGKAKTKSGGMFGGIFNPSILKTPSTFPKMEGQGKFPTLEKKNENGGGNFNNRGISQAAPQITINITVNGNMDKEILPELEESFGSQIEKYFGEYQRRSFAW